MPNQMFFQHHEIVCDKPSSENALRNPKTFCSYEIMVEKARELSYNYKAETKRIDKTEDFPRNLIASVGSVETDVTRAFDKVRLKNYGLLKQK